ncbi:N-acetylmuramoyl-L-alanine amidase [Bacillus sp. FSL W8-0645]|uniref:N-acetylmuramoyl-L-alanine amidase n=1 Tax=Bacillus sp. FSL W8-0645 TaxID=2954627 RepID=UPI0030FA0534
MVQIYQDFIPVGNGNRPGYAMTPEYVTVHNTANTSKGADAKSHAAYVKSPTTEVSWHFTVDDHEIFQHLPLNENGWHAGDGHGKGNRKSIGIEICENEDGNFRKAVKHAQWLIQKLLKEHHIPLANVVTHQYWSGKACPRQLLSTWDEFKKGIETAEDPETVITYVVKSGDTLTSIAKAHGVTVQDLQKWNDISDPNKIQIGQVLKIYRNDAKSLYELPGGVLKVTSPLTKGEHVRLVQQALAAVYFYPDKAAANKGIDGVYGEKTANAVARFQLVNGLPSDGIYGPKTKEKLLKLLSK